mgnify:CR=1 FL=1
MVASSILMLSWPRRLEEDEEEEEAAMMGAWGVEAELRAPRRRERMTE